MASARALVGHWLEALEPKTYLPLVITQATLSGNGLLAVLLSKLGQKASLFRSRNLGRVQGKRVGEESRFIMQGAPEFARCCCGGSKRRRTSHSAGRCGRTGGGRRLGGSRACRTV